MAFPGCQDSDAKKNNDHFSFEKSWSNKKLSTKTLTTEWKAVVLEKSESQQPAKSELIALSGMWVSQNEVFQGKHFRSYFWFLRNHNSEIKRIPKSIKNQSFIFIMTISKKFVETFGFFEISNSFEKQRSVPVRYEKIVFEKADLSKILKFVEKTLLSCFSEIRRLKTRVWKYIKRTVRKRVKIMYLTVNSKFFSNYNF